MNPTQPTGITPEQLKARFASLTEAQRGIFAQRLPLQIEVVQNNRALALLAFEDGTDQFSTQIANLQKQLDVLNAVITEQAK